MSIFNETEKSTVIYRYSINKFYNNKLVSDLFYNSKFCNIFMSHN